MSRILLRFVSHKTEMMSFTLCSAGSVWILLNPWSYISRFFSFFSLFRRSRREQTTLTNKLHVGLFVANLFSSIYNIYKDCDDTWNCERYLVMFAKSCVFNTRVHSAVTGRYIVNDKIVSVHCHSTWVSIHNCTVDYHFSFISTKLVLIPPIYWFRHAWIADQRNTSTNICCYVSCPCCKHRQCYIHPLNKLIIEAVT